MSVPAAQNFLDLAAAGITPRIFSEIVNVKYYAQTFISDITRVGQYTALKNMGDRVSIPNRGQTVTSPYYRGQTLTYAAAEMTSTDIYMNRARKWALTYDDVDAKQNVVDVLNEQTDDGAKTMARDIETEFLADVPLHCDAANTGTTAGAKTASYNIGAAASAVSITTSTILQFIVNLKAVLQERDTGYDGPTWVVMPQWMRTVALLSDLKAAMLMGDNKSALRTGLLGEIDAQVLYCSNLFTGSVAGVYPVIAGNMDAINFYAQLTKVERFRNPTGFGDLARGLELYDWGVVKPQGLVTGYVSKG